MQIGRINVMEKFFSLSNNELQCVTDKINIDAPFFKEKFRIIDIVQI